jgi:hypothetical protein
MQVGVVVGAGKQQVPPLRCAPVGMTILFGGRELKPQEELSLPLRSGRDDNSVWWQRA